MIMCNIDDAKFTMSVNKFGYIFFYVETYIGDQTIFIYNSNKDECPLVGIVKEEYPHSRRSFIKECSRIRRTCKDMFER